MGKSSSNGVCRKLRSCVNDSRTRISRSMEASALTQSMHVHTQVSTLGLRSGAYYNIHSQEATSSSQAQLFSAQRIPIKSLRLSKLAWTLHRRPAVSRSWVTTGKGQSIMPTKTLLQKKNYMYLIGFRSLPFPCSIRPA